MELENVVFRIAEHHFKRGWILFQGIATARSVSVFYIFYVPDVNHATTRPAESRKHRIIRGEKQATSEFQKLSLSKWRQVRKPFLWKCVLFAWK